MPANAFVPIETSLASQFLPRRGAQTHKGDYGTLGVLAGSRRYRGAALLGVEGALRCGTGIVCLASVEEVCQAAAVRLPCCTLLPLPAGESGGIGPQGADLFLQQRYTALLTGSGLTNTRESARLIHQLILKADHPMVLDADALNVLAGHWEEGPQMEAAAQMQADLARRSQNWVLTPHVGEMARLCGLSAAEVSGNQILVAKQYAQFSGCVVVLKSYATVVATPQEQVYYYNSGGNPGLAKAGSGDVLAGLIGGYLAQGLEPQKAAALGVWLHGSAAELARKDWGTAGMSLADLPAYAAKVLQQAELNIE